MAKLDGSLYLSERQIKKIAKGKLITIWREGKQITIGLKPRNLEIKKILSQIATLKARYDEERKKHGKTTNHEGI